MPKITDDQIEQWDHFRGRPNTEAVLREKAQIVAELVKISADIPFDIAREVEAATPLRIEQRHRSRLEGIAFGLRIADELAKRNLPPEQVDFLLTKAEHRLSSEFCNDLLLPQQFANFLNEKYEDYGSYKRWSENDPGTGVTLFWEYARRQAHMIGVGKSAIYNTLMTTMLLRTIVRWGLDNLLKA